MLTAVSNEPKRNNKNAAIAIAICPINFCNDVNPKFRLKITFNQSSINPTIDMIINPKNNPTIFQ